MYRIENLSSGANQKQVLLLPDGTGITIELRFVEMQYGWFMNMTYGDFILNGIRIVNSPCMLYQFRNQLPFGLAVFTEGGREPTLQDDFLSGASKLYILTESEVEEFTEFLGA